MPELTDAIASAARVQLTDGEVVVSLPAALGGTLKRKLEDGESISADAFDPQLLNLHLPAIFGPRQTSARVRRTLVSANRRDPVLIKALRTAHAMVAISRTGVPHAEAVPSECYQRRLLRLAFLSPDIQRAILAGRQPAGLRLEDLVRNAMPNDWNEQQRWIDRLAG